MAKVIPVGEAVNDAERRAIAHLRDNLPDGYLLLHNFEVIRNEEYFEVDLAVVAPHAVYLVDVKGTRGLIDVHGPKWYPQGRQPFVSPLLKLRNHSRTVKGLISRSQPNHRDLEAVFVDGIVLLTADDASFQDATGRDAPSVTTLKKSATFFKNKSRIPGRFSKSISSSHNMVLKALQGVSRPKSGPTQFGNWEVTERLGATDQYVEFRAVNTFAGASAGTVLLRAYQADPYLTDDERDAQRVLIANAYAALSRMPGHPCIVGARDFFPTESESRYILVTEDVPGQALRLHIDKPKLTLTLDQQLRVAADVLSALEHAHKYEVIHRNITPSNILVGADGRARLTNFDFARPEQDRSRTIAHQIVDVLEQEYQAPEAYREPQNASASSDVFSAGLVLYELFTGEPAFSGPTEVFDQSGQFASRPSELRNALAQGFDSWLQSLCAFEPEKRPSAKEALASLKSLRQAGDGAEAEEVQVPAGVPPEPEPAAEALDYYHLQSGIALTNKYVVEKPLGKPGAFGVVYKVIDTLGDVSRALKLILRDRHSTLDRLKKEYRTLLRTPEHPNVVKVIDADLLPNEGPPFIVFEYIEGLDVGEMIEEDLFSPEDAYDLACQVTEGLSHLHQHGVYHCDIKPRNLLWTDNGAKIIDFNVSSAAALEEGQGGGSRRYLPPDFEVTAVAQPAELADRDLYALGVTLYEAATGRYPWETAVPPVGNAAADPRDMPGLTDLAPDLVAIMLKAIAPKRADRFTSADELRDALQGVARVRRARATASTDDTGGMPLLVGGDHPPNTNPYVEHLLTFYSQSQRSNSGTRDLDAVSAQTYIGTQLDAELTPAILSGEFKLVLITGNAGDGKTTFLRRLERKAETEQAMLDTTLDNGAKFELNGRTFISNYDGSQDEGERSSDDVLREFFAPFAGNDSGAWPTKETRLIAINEGRLVDYLASEAAQFPLLAQTLSDGLVSGQPAEGVAVINLNLRSVVAGSEGMNDSILERLVQRMTHETFWEACQSCDLKDRCYALHNAQTFQDSTAGPKVIERLKALYMLTHLRGRLHITLRDLRSALAYMLVGTRDCADIHQLYVDEDRHGIEQSFYFNSWMGGDEGNADRLLALLSEVDVGVYTDPKLDRELDFVSPSEDRGLFRFTDRGSYDRALLRRSFSDLSRDFSGKMSLNRVTTHQAYVSMTRRRSFFERRDNGWKTMLPYHTGEDMLALISGQREPELVLPELLDAINRGEGLSDPGRLDGNLALQVREVERGTIRSYRLYEKDRFSLEVRDDATRARFVEHMPSGLVLRYQAEFGMDAELAINLDVFEMLQRLNEGYRPSVEEQQGYYLSLSVFKNLLGSAPYQEVLLTSTGHDFYKVWRHESGLLEMDRVAGMSN